MTRKAEDSMGGEGAARVLEQAPYAIALADPFAEDQPLVYVNRAFTVITGYAFNEAVGRNCRFLQGADTDPAAVRAIREALDERRELTVTLKNYRAGGAAFWNELNISPVFDDRGRLAYFLGIQREVPEPAARETDVMLRELQHRVKNHLAMMVSLIRVEAREAGRSADAPDSERLNRLVGRVESLQLLYDQLNERRDATETIDFAAYLSQLTASLTALSDRPGIRIEIRAEHCLLGIDRAARVGMAVSELVTNALKHAFPDRTSGLVEVSLRRLSGNRMRLRVDDDGVGLSDVRALSEAGIGGRLITGLLQDRDVEYAVEDGQLGTSFRIDFVDDTVLGAVPASGGSYRDGRPDAPRPEAPRIDTARQGRGEGIGVRPGEGD